MLGFFFHILHKSSTWPSEVVQTCPQLSWLDPTDMAVASAIIRWSRCSDHKLLCHHLSFPEQWLTSFPGSTTTLSTDGINTHSGTNYWHTHYNHHWTPSQVHLQRDLVPWTHYSRDYSVYRVALSIGRLFDTLSTGFLKINRFFLLSCIISQLHPRFLFYASPSFKVHRPIIKLPLLK